MCGAATRIRRRPSIRLNGAPAIGVGVAMQKGGNILDLGEALEKEIARIES